jgi:antirestriction protein ArdC
MLWAEAVKQGFASPTWMTYRQACEQLDAHVRKGEKGSLVAYANSITRTELTATAKRPSAKSIT